MVHVSYKELLRIWKLKPVIASDCVLVKDSRVLLIRRAVPPFKGWWCLPGGLMDTGESIEQTALREIKEETGIKTKIISLVGIYSGPKRDPRGTTVSVCYLLKQVKVVSKPDREVSEIRFFPFDKLPKNIGFDHGKMIRDALKLLRKRKR